ncbi:dehydrogenase [Reticulibacter mediterranei]|uniref:Dehydrogenase n=1 Tax=Reticulibacter mediterranei TaxID=2778369 RepID=A0A8J3IF48_9CHLR|nr:Gfo/Idh/MocA family oxidoreductase [Reticulibacter mediterranei]GHO90462.1 dehydrogenase [Reticulibacter mediterranei]
MNKLGVGLIGCGSWGTGVHLPALQANPAVRVVAVASRSAQHAEAAARDFEVPHWYTNYRDLLANPEVEIVDICTPNSLHAEIAIAAAQAGKHIICIKPLAANAAQAEAMLEAARLANVRIFYAENGLFIPAVQQAKAAIDEGAIGKVFRVRASEGIQGPHAPWSYDPAIAGGGCILDMAIHSLAFLRAIADSEATQVYAETDTFVHDIPLEDTAVLTVRFANGVIGVAEDSWSMVGEMDSRFEVYGTAGRVLIDMLHSQHLRVYSQTGYTYWGKRSEESKGWTYPLPMAEHIFFGTDAMFTHFFACIQENKPCRSTGEDGLAILRLAEAAYRSVRSGKAEQVSSHERRGA